MALFDEHTLFFMRIKLVNPETHALEEEKREKRSVLASASILIWKEALQ